MLNARQERAREVNQAVKRKMKKEALKLCAARDREVNQKKNVR